MVAFDVLHPPPRRRVGRVALVEAKYSDQININGRHKLWTGLERKGNFSLLQNLPTLYVLQTSTSKNSPTNVICVGHSLSKLNDVQALP